jgi:hypothetical protein
MANKRYAQTWSSILKYLKRELGTGVQLLEMSDDDIIEGLDEDVLALFSQYSPAKKYTFITEDNLVKQTQPGQPQFMYTLPVPEDENIIDIYDVYERELDEILDELGLVENELYQVSSDLMMDIVISNSYTDAAKSLSTRNTWEFFPPRSIQMDLKLKHAVVVYNTPHDNPKTVRPDMYNTTFKPLCLGTVQRWLVAKRSKFENISTPFGQINLNWQQLETDSQTNVQNAMQKLELIPPDKLLVVG